MSAPGVTDSISSAGCGKSFASYHRPTANEIVPLADKKAEGPITKREAWMLIGHALRCSGSRWAWVRGIQRTQSQTRASKQRVLITSEPRSQQKKGTSLKNRTEHESQQCNSKDESITYVHIMLINICNRHDKLSPSSTSIVLWSVTQRRKELLNAIGYRLVEIVFWYHPVSLFYMSSLLSEDRRS